MFVQIFKAYFSLLLFVLFINKFTFAKKHHLVIGNDQRKLFPISTFGYFPGGSLKVVVKSFSFKSFAEDEVSVSFCLV